MRKWLIELRKGYTQTQIAEAVGITQQMYSAIELGERRPSVEVAKKIAAVMGFNWIRFFEDECEAYERGDKDAQTQETENADAGNN